MVKYFKKICRKSFLLTKISQSRWSLIKGMLSIPSIKDRKIMLNVNSPDRATQLILVTSARFQIRRGKINKAIKIKRLKKYIKYVTHPIRVKQLHNLEDEENALHLPETSSYSCLQKNNPQTRSR